ncbi:uncharacterized protein BP01DRAFT_201868 [Aspergillus saccharolyticus JOP 1030-1]|uniref:Uncharacterized protein n=1 Tax=Aspergillus saccharolyticus JOP 1030-1 TaxID=1450539 RepID=A0A318ZBA4_9EURO|nr:hypothetical protein BP01DRAFT_201868 [Aspergillus saccharolyticus JOP 1030-1]PYH40730.1 hypothetical protein BP01DRAFT_201868 [Aspergillus saccharolyticus JOP 1030-1]
MTGHSAPEAEKHPAAVELPAESETPPQKAASPDLQPGEYNPFVGAKPSSPFYRHATPSVTIDRLKAESEKPKPTSTQRYISPVIPESPPMFNVSALESGSRHESSSNLWGQPQRRCGCMSRLSRKQRMMAKGVIAVVVLGTMIAIAVGITVAVGGAVWRSDHRQELIG